MNAIESRQRKRIERQLNKRLPYRKIARDVGVALGTVGNVARSRSAPLQMPIDPPPLKPQAVAAYHCDGCGYRVALTPCQICQARRLRASK